MGQRIEASDYPYRELSILAAAYRCSVPATVHVGIGYDIIHEHPNCDGAALGAASYRDFLIFARSVESLEGGVMLSFGSAIMAPEVYLKALAMARNVAHQEGREIRHFTTAVFDLMPIEGDFHRELPKTDPAYYFRPRKTILVRTVADGGAELLFLRRSPRHLPRPVARDSGERRMNVDGNPGGAFPRSRRWWWAISASIAGAATTPRLAEPSRETGIPRIAVI